MESAPLEGGGEFDFVHFIGVFEVIVIVPLKLASKASRLGDLDDDEDVQNLQTNQACQLELKFSLERVILQIK